MSPLPDVVDKGGRGRGGEGLRAPSRVTASPSSNLLHQRAHRPIRLLVAPLRQTGAPSPIQPLRYVLSSYVHVRDIPVVTDVEELLHDRFERVRGKQVHAARVVASRGHNKGVELV